MMYATFLSAWIDDNDGSPGSTLDAAHMSIVDVKSFFR
jgi:hypothetical protein